MRLLLFLSLIYLSSCSFNPVVEGKRLDSYSCYEIDQRNVECRVYSSHVNGNKIFHFKNKKETTYEGFDR